MRPIGLINDEKTSHVAQNVTYTIPGCELACIVKKERKKEAAKMEVESERVEMF